MGLPLSCLRSLLHFSCPAASYCLNDASIGVRQSSYARPMLGQRRLQKQAGWPPHAICRVARLEHRLLFTLSSSLRSPRSGFEWRRYLVCSGWLGILPYRGMGTLCLASHHWPRHCLLHPLTLWSQGKAVLRDHAGGWGFPTPVTLCRCWDASRGWHRGCGGYSTWMGRHFMVVWARPALSL